MNITESAGGLVQNVQGQVLVVSQNGDSWSLPKGHLDKGESPLEAARREIYEEAGIRELQLVKQLGTYERARIGKGGADDPSELKRITMFYFRTKQTKLKPVDPENPEARWVSKHRVPELLTHPKDKEFYRKAIKEIARDKFL